MISITQRSEKFNYYQCVKFPVKTSINFEDSAESRPGGAAVSMLKYLTSSKGCLETMGTYVPLCSSRNATQEE